MLKISKTMYIPTWEEFKGAIPKNCELAFSSIFGNSLPELEVAGEPQFAASLIEYDKQWLEMKIVRFAKNSNSANALYTVSLYNIERLCELIGCANVSKIYKYLTQC